MGVVEGGLRSDFGTKSLSDFGTSIGVGFWEGVGVWFRTEATIQHNTTYVI